MSGPNSTPIVTVASPLLGEDTLSQGRRSLRQLASEALGGFAAGVRVTIEVAGARTGGRFVLPSVDAIDPVAVMTALRQSIREDATDFAWLGQVRVVTGDDRPDPILVQDAAARAEVFAAVGLPSPRTLADLDVPVGSAWIQVEGAVSGYVPGSAVALVVTSAPLVLAEAVVDRNGNAEVVGALPLAVLEAGGHRVRLVGVRALGGVRVDDDGQIQLEATTLDQIERFDGGSQALVTVVGQGPDGSETTAMRVVPLGLTAPWWTLWIVGGAAVLGIIQKRRGSLRLRRRLGVVAMTMGLAAGPALVLGWRAAAWPVMGWGSVIALLGITAVVLVRARQPEPPPELDHGSTDGTQPLVPVG